ncbi:hypothetical protein K7X08_023772 [Anisodus acutangulus]|uniref:Uncharacterized protein n=1 Tax=Anisodus acutangulus TaxID=402998 RepID=A0A9Q1QXB4_9SOLA|nr:hypothetical protein K7X08_023772 [Anisodus acutangulus]
MSLHIRVAAASLILSLLLLSPFVAYPQTLSGQESFKKAAYRLTKPLISDDGKVYVCSEKNFFAFESNGSITWTLSLNYKCSPNICGCRNQCLFAYRLQGKLHWSVGPLLYQHGYHQGCRKNITECHFSSVPVFDHCEASIYISNNQGEIYALSTRSPHFKWIQDFSSFGNTLTMTPGNNGLLYVTVAAKALVLAVDVSRGSILWQKSFGPLCIADYAPIVDSNVPGWISIGSLDGYLYSFSPKGVLKKLPKVTEIEGKITRIIGDYTYISAMKPKGVIFTLINPATGTTFWSEKYPGQLSSEFLRSDLQHFHLDASVLLAFFAASNIGNPLPCRS